MPRVSVIIATYNWSSVLRYAIASVLAQSHGDFELLVVGDGCTDDSEGVAASFGDSRVRWQNLERNSGNQSAPNNRGLELARGELVAYLGQDDLWHPEHLEVLVRSIDASGADLVYSVAQVVGAPGSNDRRLFGLAPDGRHRPRLFAPPSAVLHRRDLIDAIGGWRDYRTIRLPPDFEFLRRAWEHGKRIVPVNELTVFKFPSGLRPNSYLEKRSDEQADASHRIAAEFEFRYRELMATLRSLAGQHPDLVSEAWIREDVAEGEIVEQLRAVRGLPAADPFPQSAAGEAPPISEDLSLLRRLNRRDDIAPLRFRQTLHVSNELPSDGLLLGPGWHDIEQDEWGLRFRWARARAQLVRTRPSVGRTRLWIEAFPGPAVKDPLAVLVRDHQGVERTRFSLGARARIEIEWPWPDAGTTIDLTAAGGGYSIPSDPRILDFALASFDWIE
jgi:glycosyltransferase involved in cell wall biosynthesis